MNFINLLFLTDIFVVTLFIALIFAVLLSVIIFYKNKRITEQNDSIKKAITFAGKMQKMILPPQNRLKDYMDMFIFFKPRYDVSGDFYWMLEKNDKLIIAVADCTGKGVSGAFISMLGVAFLNEIVDKENEVDAAEILNKLRDSVVDVMNQEDKPEKEKEYFRYGMDIALCVIDHKKMTLQYAGANNPLILIRNNVLEEIKANKMSVGYSEYHVNNKFTNHERPLFHNDCIYMFSDGFKDQIDRNDKKKFSSQRLNDSLLKVCELPMDVQQILIEQLFNKWKGNENQIDDVLLLGIKILN